MKKAFCFLMVILLLPIYAAAETKFILTPFDVSCDLLIETLKITIGKEVDDNKVEIEEGFYLPTETSNIFIAKDDTLIYPRVNGVTLSIKPSQQENIARSISSLTGDAVDAYIALTFCDASKVGEVFERFLSLGIVDSVANQTNVNTVYTIYEDCLFALDIDYEKDNMQYTILRNPFVEKPKFKEFENQN